MERRSLKKIRASTGFEPVTSAIPVRCSTNWAMKPHIGSEVNLLSSYLPVQWNDVKFYMKKKETVINMGDQNLPKIKLHIAVRAILMFWNDPNMWIFLKNEKHSFINLLRYFSFLWTQFKSLPETKHGLPKKLVTLAAS